MTTTATNTVIVAAIVAALALAAIALFTYQGAQATREAACWAEIDARFGERSPPGEHVLVERCKALR
jgi:hypothetical protein